MPIRPIDLQTVLVQMTQVSRDQAAEKDAAAVRNSHQGEAARLKSQEATEAVLEAEEASGGAGPEAIGERHGGSRRKAAKEGEGEAEENPENVASKEEVVRDPELGNRVDLSG